MNAVGTLTVTGADAPAVPDTVRVGVDRGFLLDALDAAGRGQLVLELDGPVSPLAVRLPDDDRTFSLLRPGGTRPGVIRAGGSTPSHGAAQITS